MNGKIKILWFCSDRFTGQKTRETGSWLHSMSKGLVESGEIELYNITQGNVKQTARDEYLSINQWVFPKSKLNRKGLPPKKTVQAIQNIVAEIQPDIIHVWGTEAHWGLLTARDIVKGTTLLEIQGLKFEISNYFYSGLSAMDLCSSIYIKDILKPLTSIFGRKISFKNWGNFEKEMIAKHNYINTQSEWVRITVERINRKAVKYNTVMSLRDEFIVAKKWDIDTCTRNRLFTSTSSLVSYKGLHVLIDAVELLVKDFPDIHLNIASSLDYGLRRDGYTRFIFKKIKKKGLTGHVNWLGSLTAPEIVNELRSAHVTVVPSFVESYSLAAEESMFVGVPTVASFAGAMPELGKHRESISFFQPGSANMCASEIKKILENDTIAVKLSDEAYRSKQDKRNDKAIKEQISIYKDILNKRFA